MYRTVFKLLSSPVDLGKAGARFFIFVFIMLIYAMLMENKPRPFVFILSMIEFTVDTMQQVDQKESNRRQE